MGVLTWCEICDHSGRSYVYQSNARISGANDITQPFELGKLPQQIISKTKPSSYGNQIGLSGMSVVLHPGFVAQEGMELGRLSGPTLKKILFVKNQWWNVWSCGVKDGARRGWWVTGSSKKFSNCRICRERQEAEVQKECH